MKNLHPPQPFHIWLVLILLTPARLVLPAYVGPGEAMLRAVGWTLFSSMWWFFIFAALWPRRKPVIYLGLSVVLSILIEMVQAVGGLWVAESRVTLLGAFFLGDEASVWDVVTAVVGADLALVVYLRLASQANRKAVSASSE